MTLCSDLTPRRPLLQQAPPRPAVIELHPRRKKLRDPIPSPPHRRTSGVTPTARIKVCTHSWWVRVPPGDTAPPIRQKSFPVLGRALAPSTRIPGPQTRSHPLLPDRHQGISHESSDLSSKPSSCRSSICLSRTDWKVANFAFLAILCPW